MSFFGFGKKKRSAGLAKDRLKMMLEYERTITSVKDFNLMKDEIVEVMKKYINIQKVNILKKQKDNQEILEFEIFLKEK